MRGMGVELGPLTLQEDIRLSMFENRVVRTYLCMVNVSSTVKVLRLGSTEWIKLQGDSFGTRPKKMRISQRLFIRF